MDPQRFEEDTGRRDDKVKCKLQNEGYRSTYSKEVKTTHKVYSCCQPELVVELRNYGEGQ
jgi:hypothetical protein